MGGGPGIYPLFGGGMKKKNENFLVESIMKKRSTHISLFLTSLFGVAWRLPRPPRPFLIIPAGGGGWRPFYWHGLFEICLCGWIGPVSYWSQDGTSANGSEPDGNVSVSVSGGLYSIMIGDTQIAGMGEVDEAVFQNHNDVHLRVWFSDGVNGFQQISPDRRFASVPFDLLDSRMAFRALMPRDPAHHIKCKSSFLMNS